MFRRTAQLVALLAAVMLPTTAMAAELPPAPNDPLYAEQWSLGPETSFGIDLRETWRFGQGDGVVVAVLDSGITDHPEFKGRILPGYDFISDLTRAGDGDGRDADATDPGDWVGLDDVANYRYGTSCDEAVDSSWHGTHVAGTILAAANNGIGIAGIAPLAQLLPVRVVGHCGGITSDLIDAMRWAGGLSVAGVPDNLTPARILNISLVIESPCTYEMQTTVDALAARGVFIVTSVGNENAPAAQYAPANCGGTITVGASTPRGGRASYSNYGSAVDLSAPGGESDAASSIISTLNRGTTVATEAAYARASGTSMAAPHLTGLLAVIVAAEPDLPSDDLFTLLFANLAPFDTGSACTAFRTLCGNGIANGARLYAAFTARAAAVTTLAAPTIIVAGASDAVTATVDGNPVELTSTAPTVCSVAIGRVMALASGTCLLRYRRPGSSTQQPVDIRTSIIVPGNVPTLQVTAPTRLKVGRRTSPTIVTSSDAAVSITSRTPRTCRVGSAGRIIAIAVGTCRVRVALPTTAQFTARQLTVVLSIKR